MSDLLHEQLSALVDGELPPEETALLMRRLQREPELAQRLTRYRAVGDALRGERVRPTADFAARISAAVATEPAPVFRAASAPLRRSVERRWLRPLLGVGVAAAVGGLTLMLLAHDPRTADVPVAAQVAAAPMALSVAATTAPSVAPILPSSVEPASYVTPAASESQLRRIGGATLANYVAAHARVSGSIGGRDVLIHLVSDPSAEDANQP